MNVLTAKYHIAETDGAATFSGNYHATITRYLGTDAGKLSESSTEDEIIASFNRFAMFGYVDHTYGFRRHCIKRGRSAYINTDGRTRGITRGQAPARI